jgi:hypothetical protein
MATKNIEFNKNYWDSFYASNHKHTPSQFCVCVLTEIKDDTIVVELGSGNGRDSHYFASQGHISFAMDLSDQAIKSCKEEAKLRNIHHSNFIQGDLTIKDSVQHLINKAREESKGKDIIFYSRFVMHSIDDEQELKFLRILSESMHTNEKVYFEFRSIEDSELEKHYGGHFRRYVNTNKFIHQLEQQFNYSIDYSITGRGMAKYMEEDPYVSRIIASKN